MQQIQADIKEISSLSSYVFRVLLKPIRPIDFEAGQYLQIVMGEEDKRPFSIASPPEQQNEIELHIGASPDNPYAYEVITKVREERNLQLEVGIGDAFLRDNERHAVLIAGGTGYSYTRSILLHALKNQPKRKITLYWGAKNAEDLYENEELLLLDEGHPHFTYVPVVENASSKNLQGWNGRTGLVHQAVLGDIDNFNDVEVYVAGRFVMASVIRDEFTAKGLPRDQLYGDAFAFI